MLDTSALLVDPAVIQAASTIPGNAEPSIPTLSPSGDPGIAGTIATTWDVWAGNVKAAVLWPVHKAESAYDVVTNAPANAAAFIANAEQSAVAAATGIGSYTKWIIGGVIALTVAYVVAVFAPALKGKR